MHNVGRPRLYTPEEAARRERLSKLKYVETNREAINEKKRQHYHETKGIESFRTTRKADQKRTYNKHRLAYIEISKVYNRKPSVRYSEMKCQAKKRNLEFKITFDEFCSFKDIPCYYCGTPKLSIGLDRVDNTLGYTLSNVVSCCKQCNLMKQFFSKQAFIEKCKLVSKNFTQKGDIHT